MNNPFDFVDYTAQGTTSEPPVPARVKKRGKYKGEVRDFQIGKNSWVSRREFELVLSFIQTYAFMHNRLPRLHDVLEKVGDEMAITTVEKIVNSEKMRTTLYQRGIAFDGLREDALERLGALTPQQQMVIQVVTDPTRGGSLKDRLASVGVTYGVYRNWLRQDRFKDALSKVSETMIQDNIATVHQSLVKKAERGDTSAMKLFYEVSGRHDPARQQAVDFERMIGLLLEVITRYVTDTATLHRINTDFAAIISGSIPAIEGAPNNVEDAVIVQDDEPVERTEFQL